MADGTVTNFLGPKALEEHTIPTIAAAARDAGRSTPLIVASMPTCVTSDEDEARARAAEQFSVYMTRYTAYKAAFDRQGVDGPASLAVVGDEDRVAAELARYAEAGVTEFCAHPFGTAHEQERTQALIAELASAKTNQ